MMKKLLLFVVVIIIMGGITSCDSSDPLVSNGHGSAKGVFVELALPENSILQTRAASPYENNIKDLYALVFDSGNKKYLGYQKIGELTSMGGTPRKWSFFMKPFNVAATGTDGNHDAIIGTNIFLVFIANVESALVSSIGIGTGYDTVREDLKMDTSTGWTRPEVDDNTWKGLPMWGESEVFLPETLESLETIRLMRAMAKITVLFAASNDAFVPKELYLYNVSKYAWLMPDKNNLNADKSVATKVTIYDPDAVYNYDENESAKYKFTSFASAITFYVPERDAFTGGDWKDNLNIVVKGEYNGDECYYRLNLKDENKKYIPVLRNHAYSIEVRKVTGKGDSDVGAALNNETINTETDVTHDGEGILHLASYGETLLGVNRLEFHRSPLGQDLSAPNPEPEEGVSTSLQVRSLLFKADGSSDEVEWKYKFVNENGGDASCSWITNIEIHKGGSAAGSGAVGDELVMHLQKNNTGATRTAIVRIYSSKVSSDRLYLDVKIIQHGKHLFVRTDVAALTHYWMLLDRSHEFVISRSAETAYYIKAKSENVRFGVPVPYENLRPSTRSGLILQWDSHWDDPSIGEDHYIDLYMYSEPDPAFCSREQIKLLGAMKLNGYYVTPPIPYFDEGGEYHWDATVVSTAPNWEGAKAHCGTLGQGPGSSNWRLPTFAEVEKVMMKPTAAAAAAAYENAMINFFGNAMKVMDYENSQWMETPVYATGFWTSEKATNKEGFAKVGWLTFNKTSFTVGTELTIHNMTEKAEGKRFPLFFCVSD